MRLNVAILFCGFLLGSAGRSSDTPRLHSAMVASRSEIQNLLKAPLPGPHMYGGGIVDGDHFRAGALRREAPGEVEIHRDDSDIFYIISGSATIMTGGEPVQPKAVSPTESSAKSIQGGVEHQVHAGDVVVIARQQPHWFKAVAG